MPTVKELREEAKRKGCKGYSKMKTKASLEQFINECSVAPKRAEPKRRQDKGCFENKHSAVACFKRLIEQYPTLKDECACPAQVPDLQRSAGASVLLKDDDKIVGIVDEKGVMRKVSPPLKAPPSPPPLPTFKATQSMKEALKNTKPLKPAERNDVKNVNDVSDLLADIRKGRNLRQATPVERKAIKKGGLEDAIAQAMKDRRRAIHGD